MNTYPDLQGGRFAVIADFEDPRHFELFRPASVNQLTDAMFSQLDGRPETGTNCLMLRTDVDGDTVVISDAESDAWHLKRDWRPFDLLLLTANARRRGVTLQIVVSAGPDSDRRASGATIPLDLGWTTARVDLAAMAERIPLDDVREIRISVTGPAHAAEIPIDDIILTSSRFDLLGDSAARDGQLYVQQVGRQWRIGAWHAQRGFELTFANGRIVAWYNTVSDPHRLRNLVRGAQLGPTPMVIGPTGATDDDFKRLGSTVVARTRIVEMSPVRAVVTAEWRFVDDPDISNAALRDRPFQRWVYTIYPTGQVYVSVEASAATPEWSAPELGLVVTLADAPNDTIETTVVGGAADDAANEILRYATARTSTSDSILLFAAVDAAGLLSVSGASVDSADGAESSGWVSLVAAGEPREDPVQSWTAHLVVDQSSRVTPEEVVERVTDLARPRAPIVQAGRLIQVSPGSPTDHGFDRGAGCYIVAPAGGRVRLVFDGSERPYFSPCVRVLDATQRQAWVYVDDRVVDPVARDAQGHIILQLIGTIRDRRIVEVLFRRGAPDGGS